MNVPEKFTLVALVPAGLPMEINQAPKKETKDMIFSDVFKKE